MPTTKELSFAELEIIDNFFVSEIVPRFQPSGVFADARGLVCVFTSGGDFSPTRIEKSLQSFDQEANFAARLRYTFPARVIRSYKLFLEIRGREIADYREQMKFWFPVVVPFSLIVAAGLLLPLQLPATVLMLLCVGLLSAAVCYCFVRFNQTRRALNLNESLVRICEAAVETEAEEDFLNY